MLAVLQKIGKDEWKYFEIILIQEDNCARALEASNVSVDAREDEMSVRKVLEVAKIFIGKLVILFDDVKQYRK